ncbi:hypothetical protein [Ascidiimonas sp. W6]|uniref:hypothetical protein n=1 Tax=Ascidiimonas meishanensis TaxID=3128903 RepID=UPI0030ED5D4A
MSKEKILEYLYIDESRLDKYFQQFSSPEKTEKSILKKFKLGITNAGFEINQSKRKREYTLIEKIEMFEKHITKHKQLNHGRPNDRKRWNSTKVFVKENIIAQKVYLAPSENKVNNGLNIWIEENKFKEYGADKFQNGHLFLIEDFKGEDKQPRILSGYTILNLVIDDYYEELKKTILGTKRDDFYFAGQNDSFSIAPLIEFRQIGAKFLDKRNITVVYRLRASCNDSPNGGHVSTFGYPIYIIENQ